jgi:hypothetical protein
MKIKKLGMIAGLLMVAGCGGSVEAPDTTAEPAAVFDGGGDDADTRCQCPWPYCVPILVEPGPTGPDNPLTPADACTICDDAGKNCLAWVPTCYVHVHPE